LAEGLRRLVGPYEIMELADRQSVTLRVVTWEQGSIVIHPRYEGAPSEKEIPVLRVHLWAGYKPYQPMYWDITSKTLMAQLLPLLLERGFENYEYVITAYGVAPRKRFTLERRPL